MTDLLETLGVNQWFALNQLRTDELMDDPTLEPSRHAQALAGLARLNRASFAANCLWREIAALARRSQGRTVKVLEIASGGGDILFDLARHAKSTGLDVQFTGSDFSATAVELAQKKFSKEFPEIKVLSIDALKDQFPEGFDIVMTSLFTHHLDAEQVKLLLGKMHDASRDMVIVSDLERSLLNLCMVWMATRILSRSDVVHFDGPVSVQAAYTSQEFLELAKMAGLPHSTVSRILPCRFLFSSTKNGTN